MLVLERELEEREHIPELLRGIRQSNLECAIQSLRDLLFEPEVDDDFLIVDPETGVLTSIDLWLHQWGILDRTLNFFDGVEPEDLADVDMSVDRVMEIALADDPNVQPADRIEVAQAVGILREMLEDDVMTAEYISDDSSLSYSGDENE